MKKSLLAVLLAVAMVAPAFASSLFLGGELGYNQVRTFGYDKDKDKIVDTTVKEFTIAPEVGFTLNEKWDLGLDFGFKYADGEALNLTKRTYLLYPFVRYNVFSIGDFSILAKCSIGFYSGTEDCNDCSFVSRGYSIAIAPVVQYKLNDSWSLIATLSFLTLGYNHDENQYKDGHTSKGDEVGFNLNDGEIATIGFQYHF